MSKSHISILLLLCFAFVSCQQDMDIVEDPYAGGKEALGILFSEDKPDPEIASPGETVIYKIGGASKFIEQGLTFLINNQQVQILAYTDSTISIQVPENVSSGGATIYAQNQVFFGPRLEIKGNVSIDLVFNNQNGANGGINDIVPFQNGYLVAGSFSNYASMASTTNPIGNLAFISTDGVYVANPNFGRGTNGSINTILQLGSGKYMIAGGFSTFNRRTGINNITRINGNGSLDSMRVNLVNVDPIANPLHSYDTVAAFNGGILGQLRKVFLSNDLMKGEMITAIGLFSHYGRYYYTRSTWDMKVLDGSAINDVMRMDVNGVLDSTFNIDPSTKLPYAGANGQIYDGYLQADGKLVLVGSFTTFHGQAANRIVRLQADGTVDPTFTASGSNGEIFGINYSSVSGKYTLVGNFTTFNGKSVNQVVRISTEGTVDESLVIKAFEGGSPDFAYELKDGRIIVSGSFIKYDAVTRRGFLLLENDGSARQSNNNIGAFSGRINRVVETTSSFGHPAVILAGYIYKFDDKKVENIVKVELRNLN